MSLVGLIVSGLILIGLAFRAYGLERLAGFDYDQTVAAWWMKALLVDHKFSLIGQEISLGGMFVAPFYFYFLALFYALFRLDPISANVAVTLVSIVSMYLVYRIGEIAFDLRTGLVALLIYALSYQINIYDRTTSPSNLVIPMSALVLFLLLRPYAGRKVVVGLGFLAAMAFSVHPTALFLVFQSLAYGFWKTGKRFLASGLGMGLGAILGIAPLFIFELRHGFMMSHRLIEVLYGDGFSAASYPGVFKLLINMKTVSEMWGNILFPGVLALLPRVGVIVFGTGFLGWIVLNAKSRSLWATWLIVPLVILSIYPLHVPEYYFLGVVPALVVLTAGYLLSLPRVLAGVILGLFLLANASAMLSFSTGWSLEYKKEAVLYIVKDAAGEPFSVGYDSAPGMGNGFDYLFYWYGSQPVSYAGRNYIIVVPDSYSLSRGEKFGAVKVVRTNE